jgi:hypothetical protein
VLLLSAEDDLARTIRPRLDAAGADVSKIIAFEGVQAGDISHPPVLPLDVPAMEQTITESRIALVIVDPLMAFLDGKLDAHRDQDARRCLHALRNMAERTGAAVLLVRHLNKLNHSVALYRGGGSIGILGACHSALVVERHPDDATVRVIASNKSNLGPTPKSLAYRVEAFGDVARIAWIGESDLEANAILAHQAPQRDKPAEAMLRRVLAGGQSVPAAKVSEIATDEGISESSLKRAKMNLGVSSEKGQFSGGWMWRLPEEGHEGGQARKLTPFGETPAKSQVLAEEGKGARSDPLGDDGEAVWKG